MVVLVKKVFILKCPSFVYHSYCLDPWKYLGVQNSKDHYTVKASILETFICRKMFSWVIEWYPSFVNWMILSYFQIGGGQNGSTPGKITCSLFLNYYLSSSYFNALSKLVHIHIIFSAYMMTPTKRAQSSSRTWTTSGFMTNVRSTESSRKDQKKEEPPKLKWTLTPQGNKQHLKRVGSKRRLTQNASNKNFPNSYYIKFSKLTG